MFLEHQAKLFFFGEAVDFRPQPVTQGFVLDLHNQIINSRQIFTPCCLLS
jgi:hypothetical protein